jgi:prolyl 4-hydroxylase
MPRPAMEDEAAMEHIVPAPSAENNPDKDRLRRIGRKVRERLAAHPEVYKLPTDKAEIFAVGDFLSPDERGRLMAMIDAVAVPSRAFDADYSSGYRTSYSGDVDPNDPFIIKLQRRIDDLLGITPAYGETIQGQRYLPGQQVQAHTDWFPVDTPYWEQERRRGGQRSFTAMAVLNPVEEGGTTDFPSIGIRIEPQPGALLIWNNADEDGVPNPWTLHAGMPVTRGAKYIITKWYRTRPWF